MRRHHERRRFSRRARRRGVDTRTRPMTYECLEPRQLLTIGIDLIIEDDTGFSSTDNLTNISTPQVKVTFTPPLGPVSALGPAQLFVDGTIAGAAPPGSSITIPVSLSEGSNTLTASAAFKTGEVTGTAGGVIYQVVSAAALNIDLDTEVDPPTNLDLVPSSDSGVDNQDNVTNVTRPFFRGRGEPHAAVFLAGNGVLVGETNVDAAGSWEVAAELPGDGEYSITAWQIDPAGNESDESDPLLVFVDTQGPQVTGINIADDPDTAEDETLYDLLDPKPSVDGPTPLVHSLEIQIQDLPERTAQFLYDAVENGIAEAPGLYSVVGDHVGTIGIAEVNVTNDVTDGNPALATIELVFDGPLPDDRFTLTVADTLVDPAGNALDGESNATGPLETPLFPSGDGQPGGDFQARFTVDSRPEVAVWASGSVWADTNGNFTFDPQNTDAVNRDITYKYEFNSDDLIVGNFVADPAGTADGFDKLAAYGKVGNYFRWLVDVDNDGVADLKTLQGSPNFFNGLPITGNFDGNPDNGDEVGVWTGNKWWFDTDHDFVADRGLAGNLVGLPVVGDFDGDGNEDLAAWADDTFRIDLSSVGGTVRPTLPGLNGLANVEFRFGFAGTRERPVAADIDQDGFDDLGLWVPDGAAAESAEAGQWYFLVSGGESILERIVLHRDLAGKTIDFTPVPFGSDISAEFGNGFALPLVGNFDPPIVAASGTTGNAPAAEAPAAILTTVDTTVAAAAVPDLVGVQRVGQTRIDLDTNGNGAWDAGEDQTQVFGAPGDQLLAGDFNGDGFDEVVAFRPANRRFFVDFNGNGKWDRQAGGDRVYALGGVDTDTPVIGDFNGDGVDEIGLHRNHKFLVDFNSNGRWDGIGGGDRVYAFGAIGDLPVTGDFNGDGRDDLGVYRPANQTFYLDTNGNGRLDSNDAGHQFGAAVELPVAGDFNGDGRDEIGAFAAGTFYLDTNGNGKWDDEADGDRAYDFGNPDDAPLTGRWADAVDDLFAAGES